jgi:hypothetical protein
MHIPTTHIEIRGMEQHMGNTKHGIILVYAEIYNFLDCGTLCGDVPLAVLSFAGIPFSLWYVFRHVSTGMLYMICAQKCMCHTLVLFE